MSQEQFEEAFKFVIEVFAYNDRYCYRNTWLMQIYEIDEYWSLMLDSFNKVEFRDMFNRYCEEEFEISSNDFNLENEFEKAKSGELKTKLMTSVADEIAHTHIPGISYNKRMVFWTGSMMIIDWRAIL